MLGIIRTLIRELVLFYAFIERNFNLLRRYLTWEILFFTYSIVNALTIGLIMVGKGNPQDALYLVIGPLVWGFLSIMMREVSDAITWERWEGTIEYTFMAPIHRITHLIGSCFFAILYGVIRTGIVLAVMPLFFGNYVDLSQANWLTMVTIIGVSSLSFIGIGLMTAVFPLLSPEKGQVATGILQALLLLIAGIYYEIEVLPRWLQPIAIISPATYALRSTRSATLKNASVIDELPNLLLPFSIGLVTIPIGFYIFHLGEKYAKRVGRLKRSG
ncbi:MAG: hypothetical protein CBC13_08470 [Planctomycetia bacterium TMED53]|nr:MAG: hypothetical protein CBC13_08470 [Planctomycetia bacterium TMED53]